MINGHKHELLPEYEPEHFFLVSPENVLNLQIPYLDDILSQISEIFFDAELHAFASPDVLSKTEYPFAHEIAVNFLQKHRSMQKQQFFPRRPKWDHKLIERTLSKQDIKERKRKIVQPSDTAPLCYKYALSLAGRYLGDIFIVPVMTRRTAAGAALENAPTASFDTLILAVEASARKQKKKKHPSDFIEVECPEELEMFMPLYQEDEAIAYFSVLTHKPVADQAVIDLFAEQTATVVESWWYDTVERSRRKAKGWR